MDELTNLAKRKYLQKVRSVAEVGSMSSQEDVDTLITRLYGRSLASLKIFPNANDPKLRVKLMKFAAVIPIGEAFDVVYDAHVECKHGSVDDTHKLVSRRYVVPLICVQWVIESCLLCNPHLNEFPAMAGSGEWRLSCTKLYENTRVYDPQRRAVLIYKEDKSNFMVLRPVSANLHESGMELLVPILFYEYGFPEKVYVTENLAFFDRLFDRLHRFYKGYKSKVVVELSDNIIFEEDKTEVIREFTEWAGEATDPLLDIGCNYVQHKWNTTQKVLHSLRSRDECVGTPINLFYMKSMV